MVNAGKRARLAALLLFSGILLLGAAPTTQSAATATLQPEATAGSTATPQSTSAADETIVEEPDQGYWFYESKSQGIRIEITRHEDTDNTILWYEADLRFAEQSPLQFLVANEDKPGKGFYYPERLIRDHKAVFGINDDQFGHRVYNHDTTGIIIRNGVALYTKTNSSGNLGWPTLDTAAFFPDGTMRVFASEDHTADEYLQMGAQTVLSFGPWLVKDGETNPLLAKYFKTREPRSAIGMVEPYHFVVVSVEGREKRSRGVGVQWLADRMQELHATEAMNLDGGKTCCIVFMGKKLDTTNPTGAVRSGRSVSGMIALGTSEQVPDYTGLE
ncbi:MAG TPA: phosphodiester glycosidase family protein [Candidatus Limiplasma sp.]|nr:phosphodiester glycosidase family protein [Candidatus Limiplasma sp.]HPS82030.1 phosphodiester glycosidase family protein [Candidatus Limiplasma sp.]